MTDHEDLLTSAARAVVHAWRELNERGPNTSEDWEVVLDNAIIDLENAL